MIEHTGAQVLVPYLISTGVVSKPGGNKPWPCFTNNMPETPNQAVCVYNTVGEMQGRSMPTKEVFEYPGIQLRIRALGDEDGSNIGLQLCNKLALLLGAIVVIGMKTYRIHSFQRTTSVIPIGQEEGGSRFIYTINGLITYGENI